MGDDGARSPATDAFALLGHEIRLDILRAFFERYEPIDPDSRDRARSERTMSYAELMAATGLEDSGKFNYHLEKLRGAYVEKVEGGYVPTASAIGLYEAVMANRPTEDVPVAIEIDEHCPRCDTRLRWDYEQEFLTVDCPACEEFWGLTYRFPKNGLAVRDGEGVYQALYDRMQSHVDLARTGQCPACAGLTNVSIPRERLDGESVPTVELRCGTCSWLVTVDVLTALQFEPRVASALLEVGVPIDGSDGSQGTEAVLPSVSARPRSDAGGAVAITIEHDDAVVDITVTETLAVQSVVVE